MPRRKPSTPSLFDAPAAVEPSAAPADAVEQSDAPPVPSAPVFDAPAAVEPSAIVEPTGPAVEPTAAPAAAVNAEDDIPAANGQDDAPPVVAPDANTVEPTAAPAAVEPSAEQTAPRRRTRRRRAAADPAAQAARIVSQEQTAPAAPPDAPPPDAPPDAPAATLSDLVAVQDIKNDETAGERLQRMAVLTSLEWRWFGNIKRVSQAQNATAAGAIGVIDSKRFKGAIEVIGKDEKEWADLNSFRSQVQSWWHSITLPWVKEGERLLPREQWDTFQQTLAQHRETLAQLCARFDDALPRLRTTAASKLGENYRPDWLNVSAPDTFTMHGEARAVEPPGWLKDVRPADYEAQMAQLRQRFDAAATLATEALAQELLKAIAKLEERLTPDPMTGDRKTFRDSSVENLREFFVSFRTLNLTGDQQLEALVTRAEALLSGVSPEDLRAMPQLQDRVRGELTGLADTLESTFLIEEPSRARNIVRASNAPPPPATDDTGAA